MLLQWAITFLIISLTAFLAGFQGIADTAFDIAIIIVIAVLAVLAGSMLIEWIVKCSKGRYCRESGSNLFSAHPEMANFTDFCVGRKF